VLEDCTTEKYSSIVHFLWAKGLITNNIHKEMFPVYVGKCLSRKAIHILVEKFYQGRLKVADDARGGAKVAETTVKRLVYCGFGRACKAMRQVYQCWWRICREINDSFPGLNITRFMFYIHL
jgi:hypothetical protein